ncbi:endonuclease domain-containing 1 protein-like, partial [Trichomycterus rosablanca]|uniref:endonuclease domain-containing 1 protein-like n=1 Tax=Trichomycterus rosablanca TaxID=2290929 RepID=UPI002F356A16
CRPKWNQISTNSILWFSVQVKYATYYDTDNKIPVYSAYKFEGVGNCDRKKSWFIEPQLYQQNGNKNMVLQGKVPHRICGIKQALNRDYTGSGYHKGHLAPVSHTNTQICSDATFTLTNAAPQDGSFNEGQWRKAELEVSNILKNKCLNRGLSAYLVTGVVPGNKNINNRVNVPSYFWTAYCCLDNNKKPKVSGGYYGANKNEPVNSVSESDLESFLTGVYGKGQFQLFGIGCMDVKRQDRPEHFNLFLSRIRSGIREGKVKPAICGTDFDFACSRRRSSDEEDDLDFLAIGR